MRIIITGGAASGKSEHAERILCNKTKGSRLYVATMQPFGKAAAARIARHQTLRQGKGFETAERYTSLAQFSPKKRYDGILLECMSNLLANELFAPNGAGKGAVSAVLNGIDRLESYCRTLVVVTNEIFSDGRDYAYETMLYIEMLGEINRALFQSADVAAESVCGILVPHKGALL